MLVTAFAASPPPFNESFDDRLNGPDKGLINAWLVGLQKRRSDPELARQAEAGELPLLPFKGGVAKKIKATKKVGSLWYVAAWHGLRGEDLKLDTAEALQMTCAKTLVPVIYTLETDMLFGAMEEANDD